MPRVFGWALALVLAACAVTGASVASAQAPRIGKPRPPPPGPAPVMPLPPAQFDSNLAIGGQDIKARLVDSRLGVYVQVNGRGPYRFVVDSGADTSVVGTHIAEALQLPLGTPAILNGMTARNEVDRVKVDQLSLGQSTRTNLELPALRAADVGADGLLGIDALAQQRLMMDFETRVVRIEDARLPPPKRVFGEIVITAKRRRGQLILAHVRAGDVPLDAVIDTGSEVTIGNLALRQKLFRHPDRLTKLTAVGVTGVPVQLEMATVDELQLGPVVLYDVPIAFADVPPFHVFGLSDEPALLLGTDILENFRRVSLDFRSRKVRFQLRRCKASTFQTVATLNERPASLMPYKSTEACLR
ncbi:MAG TPA: retropepsin-like aspartic protease [Sphingomicrobium sp.]|nr:retropepsin-like aspartic protease [Sphingomicrobium sp.]